MKKPKTDPDPNIDPVYLTAEAVSSVIETLPTGTGYFIGIVMIVMMSGRLMQSKGSLARAALPFVWKMKWGWHRVERAMERGKFCLDAMFERMFNWCIDNLAMERVQVGGREVMAIDTSTVARLRSGEKLGLAGKGYWQRASRAVSIVAATSVVLIRGVRVGLVRGVRYGENCERAVENLFKNLPKRNGKRLLVVDAGIATKEQFALATQDDALLGRLRINTKLYTAPGPRKGNRGRYPLHGAVIHPGKVEPEIKACEDFEIDGKAGKIRIRRWNNLHYREYPNTIIDVTRVDDPTYPNKPLLIGTTALELKAVEMKVGYSHRWPVETNFFVAQDTTAIA